MDGAFGFFDNLDINTCWARTRTSGLSGKDRSYRAQLRFSRRPRGIKAVRKFSWTGSMLYIENGARQLEARDWGVDFSTQFKNSDQLNLSYSNIYGCLPQPFLIAIYTMTPRIFASALLQYNSSIHAVTANVRLRWEYRPGSELFVVYNEQRDTLTPRFPALANRAFIVKLNRLFRP